MTLKIYNTLTRKTTEFKPLKNKQINLFVCGPTVYDHSHLGHARVYITFDTIVKYLRYKNYKVFYLENITDIDDKIIDKANKEKKSWKEISQKYAEEFFKDIKLLRVNSVNKYAFASDYIKQIINQVKRLENKGYAYLISDGIYYDISKFKDYGKLSKQPLEKIKSGKRIAVKEEKRNEGDFVLWKLSKPNEPKWNSPWGAGRPGWHIEDTAITETEFGLQYDIHGGGLDLIFPHHEAEIAQMEAVSGKKPFVKYWMHNAFVQINNEKMSKSLNNFKTIKDLLQKYDPEVLRFLILSTHYRNPINFAEEILENAKNSLARLQEIINKLLNFKSKSKDNKEVDQLIKKTKKEFEKAMDDDINTSLAITSIFELIKGLNILIDKEKISNKDAKKCLDLFKELDGILGIFKFSKEKVPKDVLDLIAKREEARKKKDFKTSDIIRDKIKELGYYVDDSKTGPIAKKF